MDIKAKLTEITGYKYNFLAKRGNDAIWKALKIGKKLGYTNVYIADQGGWLTYQHFPPRLKMELHELKSDYGIISDKVIAEVKHSIVLLNASPAYFCFQPLKEIESICRINKNLLIVDITATIGSRNIGDILVASFAETKPVDYGKLGLVSFHEERFTKMLEFYEEPEFDSNLLLEKLSTIDERRNRMIEKSKKIKNDLLRFDILHKEHYGINVIIRYHDLNQKNAIVSYCNNEGIEFVECPKYIKVLEEAISIEVKRG